MCPIYPHPPPLEDQPISILVLEWESLIVCCVKGKKKQNRFWCTISFGDDVHVMCRAKFVLLKQDKIISSRFFYRTDFFLRPVPKNVNTTLNQKKIFSSSFFFHTRWFLSFANFYQKNLP